MTVVEIDCATLDLTPFDGAEPDALDADERRTYRAVNQPMLVVPEVAVDGTATGMYRVFSLNGEVSEYVVDLGRDATGEHRCDCGDFRHREPTDGCKHVRRVLLASQETPLPRPGEMAGDYFDHFPGEIDALRERREALREAIHAIEALIDGALDVAVDQREWAQNPPTEADADDETEGSA